MKQKITLALAVASLVTGSQAFSAERDHHEYLDIVPATADNGDIARGTVFADKNHNGRMDRGERGIRDVSVSNGLDVVRTNHRGEYEIKLPPESILFISKPAKYDVPVDKNNLPQFYYIHYPEGTPPVATWKYKVIAPTGALPTAINFPLIPAHKVETSFTAMGFADTQAKTEEEEDGVRADVVDELMGNPFGALFGITVGDVVDDTLSLYDRHNAMMGKIGIPMWSVLGNHDMNYPSPDDRYSTQTFNSVFGPTDYSFDYGNVHFIALDNVQYAGQGKRYDLGSYRGYLTDEQLTWLTRDLSYVSHDKLIVIATHISLITNALDGRGERDTLGSNINTVNFSQLLEVLKPFEHVYAMAGHDTSNSWKVEVNQTHGWYGNPWIAHTLAEVRGNGWSKGPRDERDVRDATMQDGNPNGYYLMKFNDTRVTPRFIPQGQKGNLKDRMRIVLDPLLDGSRGTEGEVLTINRGKLLPGTKLVVNLYDGGERDQVVMSFDGGVEVEMNHVVRNDPFMERQYAKFKGTPDAFSTPQPSSHIWEYDLAADLAPGLHTVVVRSKDEFGQQAEGTFTFELLN